MTPEGLATIAEIVDKLAAGGFATFLLAIIITGRMRYWMWSHQYDEMVREKDRQLDEERREKLEWRDLAFDTKRLTERSVSALSEVVDQKRS